MLVIPEAKMFQILESLIEFIRCEIKDPNTAEQDSFLYLLLQGNYDSTLDYYNEAKNIFSKSEKDERFLVVKQTLDRSRLQLPTVTLLVDEESLHKKNSVGQGQGDYSSVELSTGDLKATYSKRYSSSFQILVSSDNVTEVLIIEAVLKAGLVSIFETFSDSCLQNPRIETSAINLDSDAINASYRSISVSFFYDLVTPSIYSDKIREAITFTSKIY